jgi:DNA uptake protein ComE-like DNA-binding protein
MRKRLRWKEYFLLSQKERNGIALFILILLMIVGVRYAGRSRHTEEEAWLNPVLNVAVPAEADTVEQRKGNRKKSSWTTRNAASTRTYSQKKHEYADTSSHFISFKNDRPPTSREPLPVIDLNTADSAQLLALPGIGPYFAGKIIRYREALGGYADKTQLSEIWKIDTATVRRILQMVMAERHAIQPIPFNTGTWEELDKHPYLSKKQARALVSYREKHGPFLTPESLLKSEVMDSLTIERIRPYFAPP